MKESQFQYKIITWLKAQGCYVIKNSANPGVPLGAPDIVFFYKDTYGFIEVKPTAKSKFQPLQEVTIEKLADWSWARVVHPDNWEETQKELVVMFR